MDENRKWVLKGATIEFDRSAFSCAVRNLSEFGAALDVPGSVGIPHEFQLVIQANQLTRLCRVIWREEKRIGVVFNQAQADRRAPGSKTRGPDRNQKAQRRLSGV